MFAAVTLADQTAKRGCSSVSCPLLKTGMDVGVCCCVCVDQGGSGPGEMLEEMRARVGTSVCLCMRSRCRAPKEQCEYRLIAASGGMFSYLGGWQTGRPRWCRVWRMLGEDGRQRESAVVIGWRGKYKRLALWLVHACGGDSSNSQPPRSTSHSHIQTSSPRRIASRRQVYAETTRLVICLACCAMFELGNGSSIGCRLWLNKATSPWSSSSPCRATRGL